MKIEWNGQGFKAEMDEHQQTNIPMGLKRYAKNSLLYGLPALIISFLALLFICSVHFYADMLEETLQAMPENVFFVFYLADYAGCFISAVLASFAMVFSISSFRNSDANAQIDKGLNTVGFVCAILALCLDIACIVCTTGFLLA